MICPFQIHNSVIFFKVTLLSGAAISINQF